MFWQVHRFFSLCMQKRTYFIIKRFFTMLRFVQNDTVLFFTYDQESELFLKRKDFFILIMFLREQSLRNSFALKRDGKSAYFLSQSSRRIGEIIVFLRTLRNIGDVLGSAQVFSLCMQKRTYSIIKRFFTLLRFVQNDRVLFCSHGLKIRAIGMRYELRGVSISITKFTELW